MVHQIPLSDLDNPEIPRLTPSEHSEHRPVLGAPMPRPAMSSMRRRPPCIYQFREVAMHGRATRVAHFGATAVRLEIRTLTAPPHDCAIVDDTCSQPTNHDCDRSPTCREPRQLADNHAKIVPRLSTMKRTERNVTMDADRTPILVGCGQITQREPDPKGAHVADGSDGCAARVWPLKTPAPGQGCSNVFDTIVILRSFSDTSWRFTSPFGGSKNPPKSVADRIGANAAKRLDLHLCRRKHAAMVRQPAVREDYQRGSRRGLIAGGEALATQKAAQRAEDRHSTGTKIRAGRSSTGASPREAGTTSKNATGWPARSLPIRCSKTASAAAAAIRSRQHLQEMGRLFARFAAVAAQNPLADRRQGFTRRADRDARAPTIPTSAFPTPS